MSDTLYSFFWLENAGTPIEKLVFCAEIVALGVGWAALAIWLHGTEGPQ